MSITPIPIQSSFPVSDGFADYEFKVKNQDEIIKYHGVDVSILVLSDSHGEGQVTVPSGYIHMPDDNETMNLTFIFSNFADEVFGKNICTGGVSATGANIGLFGDVVINEFVNNITLDHKCRPAGHNFIQEG